MTRRTLAGLTAAAGIALAAGALGITPASAATGSPTTTTFSYSGQTLTAAPSNIVPPVGTAVTVDLTAQYMMSVPGETYAYVDQSVYPAQTALTGAGVPVADFSSPVAAAGQVAVSGTDDTVTLYVVANPTADTFEVSGVKGGTAIVLPPLYNVSPPVTSGVTSATEATLTQGDETVSWDSAAPAAGTAAPHLTGGHVISVSNNDAEVGWSYGPNVPCALTETFGYGMTVNGAPHMGFTCFNATKTQDEPDGDVGYWTGLASGHTYDVELIPAGTNRQPLPGEQTGWINVVTTR